MEWYYILGIISYSIFIVQFCLSFVGGETELDVDFDGDMDFSFSDLISFKGLIHFLMGFSGWLMVTREINFFTILIACVIGFFFVLVLYFIYKLAMEFQCTPTKKSGVELIGNIVHIYLTLESISDEHCICTIYNGGVTEEINCIAASPVKIGDVRIILDYKNGIYYIS